MIPFHCLFNFHFIFIISEDNVDLLREMGGAAFVYNLSKSSIVHSEVKETALFTLGTLAEANGRHELPLNSWQSGKYQW